MSTYWEAVKEAGRKLSIAGIEQGELDARYLLEFVLKERGISFDSAWYLLHRQEEMDPQEAEEFWKLVGQRGGRIPLQHLTGEQEFMGLCFRVNEHVLIPRQDTEILVEAALKRLHGGERILDLCTGSGCILLSLLHFGNRLIGVGADLSEEALDVARENQRRLSLPAKFVKSDLFENIEGEFEMIVSNPPYIATEVIEGLETEVREHEPRMALDGGLDGLTFYRKIIQGASGRLKRDGWLLFEIGYDQRAAVCALLEQEGFLVDECIRDYAGLDRVIAARNRKEEGGTRDV